LQRKSFATEEHERPKLPATQSPVVQSPGFDMQ